MQSSFFLTSLVHQRRTRTFYSGTYGTRNMWNVDTERTNSENQTKCLSRINVPYVVSGACRRASGSLLQKEPGVSFP